MKHKFITMEIWSRSVGVVWARSVHYFLSRGRSLLH